MSGDEKKRTLYQDCRQKGSESYPLKITQPELASPSLLDRVQSRPDVDVNIRLLKKQRTKGRDKNVYVPPQAKSKVQASDDTRFPLMDRVKEFLKSDKKVFLILGDSGAGKSTFSLELEHELWWPYKNETDRIPLHINLPTIEKPEHDLIAKHLRKAEFNEQQIREMKHYRKFILICDGYVESQQTHNLYMSNRLSQPGEWDVQMIISCRTKYLGADYRDRFQPSDRNRQSDSPLYQEAVITPFSLDMIHAYIHQYVSNNQPLWQVEGYKQALDLIPGLKDIVTNPFLMVLCLDVLPRMVDPGQHHSTTRVTRVELYDYFVEQWLERGKKRLGEKDMGPQAREEFERLIAEGFTANGIWYMKKFAVAIYKEQGGHPIVGYSQLMDEGSWKDGFFKFRDKQLLHEACPLTRSGNQHRFIHRSLLEYALTLAIFDPRDMRNKISSKSVLGRRGSMSSTLSVDVEDGYEQTMIVKKPNSDSPLVWRDFVNDHSLLQFLEERVQQESVFKEQLLDFIEHSKTDRKWRKAAANAITILVRAGVQFVGADLRGIQIPRADLSYGVFDSVQLQGADLRKVNLRGAWMRQTDLSRAQMKGVQFGELPFLQGRGQVRSCAYSPDGSSFAIGISNGNISVYTTSDWEISNNWSGHDGAVQCVVYSSNGGQIASSGEDYRVCLWDAAGSLQQILIGHTGSVNRVAYSPHGNQIASASDDGTVRVWNLEDCSQTLFGQAEISCVAYSLDGKQIASGGSGCTLRLWSVDKGICLVLSDHDKEMGIIRDIKYSPRGDQVASASDDKRVRLWNVKKETCRYLTGHERVVYGVAYSPCGSQLASGDKDATVRLWDTETGVCRHTLRGHTQGVWSVVYSPGGDQIASGSYDKTARLCDISVGVSRFVSSGHSRRVTGVKCLPRSNCHPIASCSEDRTIRIWDVDTGTPCQTLRGHENSVFSIAYSSQEIIASGSRDKTVRLWDVEDGKCLRTLTGHNELVTCVAFSPQGNVVASASNDWTVRLWNVDTGVCQGTLKGHTDVVASVRYSPDGNQIATCGHDCTIRLWDARTGDCDLPLIGHIKYVKDVVYSPLGNQIASASCDKTIILWGVETRELQLTLTGHSNWVLCVEYSLNGDVLVSGSEDKTVRLWDVKTGQCRSVIENFPNGVNAITWRTVADSNYLVTGCSDGSILMWQVSEEGDQIHTRLSWSATNGALFMAGSSIQDVKKLTQLNKRLLTQRGAAEDRPRLLHETSMNPVEIATDASSSVTILLVEQTD